MEQWEIDANQRATIVSALIAAAKGIAEIKNDGTMTSGGTFGYVSEKAYKEAVRKALWDQGLWLIGPRAKGFNARTGTTKDGATRYISDVTLEWDLCHTSGAIWPHPLGVTGSGDDNSGKSTTKAVTAAFKSLVDKLLMIPTEAGEGTRSGGYSGSAVAPPPPGGGAPPPAASGAPPAAGGPPPVGGQQQDGPLFQPEINKYMLVEVLQGWYNPPNEGKDANFKFKVRDVNGAIAEVGTKKVAEVQHWTGRQDANNITGWWYMHIVQNGKWFNIYGIAPYQQAAEQQATDLAPPIGQGEEF